MEDRRHSVPFDPDFFAHRAERGDPVSPLEAFRHAWRENHWAGGESRSGAGSGLDQTAALRHGLPRLFHQLGIKTLLDVPCGDWRWMSTVDLGKIDYIGGDLLPELVEANRVRFGSPRRQFLTLDLTAASLPGADLLLCRDCLVHLSFADIAKALGNVRRGQISYLLTTTFPDQASNQDIVTGDWRPLNLQLAPFHFPPPLQLLNEGCTESDGRFGDKSLGLWRVASLGSAVSSS